jgi:NADH-quinone oxidoreductase subunit N
MWTPDVYEGAPTPFTAFMASAVKAGRVRGVRPRRGRGVRPAGRAHQVHQVLWYMAVLTMVGGNVVALAQRSVKRMLAYSSIAHAGYLTVALVTSTAQGSSAIVFYLFAYTLATVGAFAVLQALGGTAGGADRIDAWAGLFAARPRLALAMAVFMLALLGFPLAGAWGSSASGTWCRRPSAP